MPRNCLPASLLRSVPALLVFFLSLASCPSIAGAAFVDISAGLTGVSFSAVAWGDYDNDGDLDLALAGIGNSGRTSKIYRNDNGAFTDIAAGLPGVVDGSFAWGDYDNDGDLDLALAGNTGSGEISRIYRNDNGAFTDIAAGLTGVEYCSLAWGDYDNDGDLDLALAGFIGSGAISKIYRNDNGVFADIAAGLEGVLYCSLAWGDYDNDGDLDLALAGSSGSGSTAKIYRNDNGAFTGIDAELVGVSFCSLAWGDYDNDGDLDLALAGSANSGFISKIYRNDNGVFTDIVAGLVGVYYCFFAWGDYDNDGDLDLALAGSDGSIGISKIYRNDNGFFTDIVAGLVGVWGSSLAWGDYDKDGYLDLAVTGDNGSVGISEIRRNTGGWGGGANTRPNPPNAAWAEEDGSDVIVHWTAGSDAETPQAGLSYTLFMGTSPGVFDAFGIPADAASGFRRVAAPGSMRGAAGCRVKGLTPGTIYWFGVQSVDSGLAGSPIEAGYVFLYGNPPPLPGLVAKTGNINKTITFAAEDFTGAVSNKTPDQITAICVAGLPAHGNLTYFGVPLVGLTSVPITNVPFLSFAPAADWHGNDSFRWKVMDDYIWSPQAGTVNLGIGPPVVSTLSLLRRGAGNFLAKGDVQEPGMGPVTDHGFQWSVGEGAYTDLSLGAGVIGAYESPLTGFAPGTMCRVRAYAVNAGGTSHGQALCLPAADPGTAAMSILLGMGGLTGGGGTALGGGAVVDGAAGAVGNDGGWSVDPDEERKRLKE